MPANLALCLTAGLASVFPPEGEGTGAGAGAGVGAGACATGGPPGGCGMRRCGWAREGCARPHG